MPSIIVPPRPLDWFVAWEPSQAGGAAFSAGIDEASATVRVMGAGLWCEQDADRYFTQQRWIVEEARRRFGPLKVFFDVRDWVVENPDSVLMFQGMNRELYRPDDRLAALVMSSVDKINPRTALGAGTREAFISHHAAETWLQAYSPSRQAA